jgi:hypothetical protein
MAKLQLSHDVLDVQLVDRHSENIGRCDALMLELRAGRPVRVAAVLIGGPAREERIGRWMTHLARFLRVIGGVHRSGVSRIPFSAMRSLGDTMQMEVQRDELESDHVERWLAEHFVCRIPGAESKQK